jgi:catechol 2,3-dioxygenase-like lactoylglutathione lyase family enzyme
MKIFLLVTFALGAVFAQSPPLQLRVSMIALGVTDTARSIRFYGDTLGFPLVGKPGEVTQFQAGDITIALNHPLGRSAGAAIAGAVEIIFPVESVAAAYGNLIGRGCRFLRAPREVTPGTWAATFSDPDGHRLTILGPR